MFSLWLIYGPLGQHGSDWSRDLVILPFDLWGHGVCGWCGSSSSVCISSLKFVGLVIRKIWRTMWVSINGPGDPDLWPCDPETGIPVASKVGNLPSKFGHAGRLGSRIVRYVRDRRTDRRDGQKQRLLPPSLWGARHNKWLKIPVQILGTWVSTTSTSARTSVETCIQDSVLQDIDQDIRDQDQDLFELEILSY